MRAPSTFTTQHCARSVTDGQLRNPSFADYKIPGIRDMPEFLTGESVAARQESGPYGAKGVGETGTFGGVGGINPCGNTSACFGNAEVEAA